MNNGIWVIVAIAAFSVGIFVGTITHAIPVADAAKSDTSQVLNRLERIVKTLSNTNSRLDAINAEFVNPPDPEEPPIQVALDSIISEANNAIATANEIKAKLVPP